MKIEYIEWIDACSVDEWHNPFTEDAYPVKCFATGFVVAENEEVVKIAASVNDSGDCCCSLIIPLVNITHREVIKECEYEDE